MDYLRRTWAEIDLDKALDNWEEIKRIANGRYIFPVVKADAYGHGANTLARLYEKGGAKGFAVSNINEAIKLRKSGISADILVLGFTPTDYINQMYAFNITQAIYCTEYAEKLSKAASDNKFTIKAHIKLDTGMGRIGFNGRNKKCLPDTCREICKCLELPAIKVEGIFTHFSSADSIEASDMEYTEKQYQMFRTVVDLLKNRGHEFKYVHCCNSAASALRPGDEGTLIRPGIILYGLSPSYRLDIGYKPVPIMSVKSAVSMVKELEPDESISYGRIYKTTSATRVATVPIGYADGYPRALSNRGKVLINGSFAPIIGRICMDQLMVDVTEIENVGIGTIVTVIGTDGDKTISFDDIAEECGTISYEIMCNISIRIPRVYLKDRKISNVVYLGGTL